jgi:hypothetical protein
MQGPREAVNDPALATSVAKDILAVVPTLPLSLSSSVLTTSSISSSGTRPVQSASGVPHYRCTPPRATIASAFLPTSLLFMISLRRTSPVETKEMSYFCTNLGGCQCGTVRKWTHLALRVPLPLPGLPKIISLRPSSSSPASGASGMLSCKSTIRLIVLCVLSSMLTPKAFVDWIRSRAEEYEKLRHCFDSSVRGA